MYICIYIYNIYYIIYIYICNRIYIYTYYDYISTYCRQYIPVQCVLIHSLNTLKFMPKCTVQFETPGPCFSSFQLPNSLPVEGDNHQFLCCCLSYSLDYVIPVISGSSSNLFGLPTCSQVDKHDGSPQSPQGGPIHYVGKHNSNRFGVHVVHGRLILNQL